MSTPQLDRQHLGSFASEAMAAGRERFLSLFTQKHAKEFNDFEAHETAKAWALDTLRALESTVESAGALLARFEIELSSYADVSFADTIFGHAKSNLTPLRVVANDLAAAKILCESREGILKLARKDLNIAREKLVTFKKENEKLIAEVQAEVDAERVAYQAAIQREQDEAIARRAEAAAAEPQGEHIAIGTRTIIA